MPDNVVAPGRGAVLVTDEIAGVHWPVTKLAIGAENVATLVSEENPLPVLVAGGATEAGLSAIAAKLPTLGQKAQSGSVSIVPATGLSLATDGGADYTQTIVTVSTGQAAGTDPIIAANASRKALQFGADANFKVALASGQADGLRVYASARDDFTGKLCPTDALYLVSGSGLVAGNSLVIWEA